MLIPADVSVSLLSPESLSASGRDADKLSLPVLQSKMKCDPEGYEAELLLLYRHFESSLYLFHHQSALSTSSDPSVAKDLADLALFLAHVTPFYMDKLSDFPRKIADLLRTNARSLPSSLRSHLAQALILLVNRKIVDIEEILELFMELQILDDRILRKLAFSHIVHYIRRMNQKHKNEAKNRKLQNILFLMLQGEEELKAKRSLVILCDLHRRRVWFEDRTANAICTACFHTSSRVMISSLSFLLGYERVEVEDDSDASSSEDDTTQEPINLSREAIYKALVTLLPYARLHLKPALLCFHGDGTGATSWGVGGEKMPREQSKPLMERLQHQFLLGVCIHLLSAPRRSCGCGALAGMADSDSEARRTRQSQPWWSLWLGLIFYKQ